MATDDVSLISQMTTNLKFASTYCRQWRALVALIWLTRGRAASIISSIHCISCLNFLQNIWVRVFLRTLPLAVCCVFNLSFTIDLLCTLYHCHEFIHFFFVQQLFILYDGGEIYFPLDDCEVNSRQDKPTCSLSCRCQVIKDFLPPFWHIEQCLFQSTKKLSPSNGSGVIHAYKLWNLTFIPVLHTQFLSLKNFPCL
jgi:hypothetical protein